MGKDQFSQTLLDVKNVHQSPIVGIKILKRANPSLGRDTTRNIRPQICLIHSILRQHKTHLRKFFSFQILYQKITQVMENLKF